MMWQCHDFDSKFWAREQGSALQTLLRKFMGLCKSFPRAKAGSVNCFAPQLTNDPFAWLVFVQIPGKGSKAIPHYLDRVLWSPYLHRAVRSVVVVSEKGVEPRHVIHVKVGKAKVLNALNL